MRRPYTACLALLALPCLNCSMNHEDTGESAAGVNYVDCESLRGTFVNASDWSGGPMALLCGNTSKVVLNGTQATGKNVFQLQPRLGLNILHVEKAGKLGDKVDLPFFFGDYIASGDPVPEAFSLRINPGGWVSTDGQVHLPLQSKAPLDLSDVATQILRDQGNIGALLEGTTKDVSGDGFTASLTVDSLSYDPSNLAISTATSPTGITLDIHIASLAGQFGWSAGALGITLGDTVDVSADSLDLSIGVNLSFTPDDGSGRGGSIVASLGQTSVNVQNLQLGSIALNSIPLLGPEIESALSAGAQLLVNEYGSQLIGLVQNQLVPPISTSLQQFNLPSNVTLPLGLGTLDLAATFDQGTFDETGDQLSIGAMVAPQAPVLSAPGSVSVAGSRAEFDTSPPFGLSLSLDYINQAFYAVWVQGGVSGQILPQATIGTATIDPIVASTKFPLLLLAKPDGTGLSLQQGELELSTAIHDPKLGSFPITLAVNLIADANISLDSTNDAIVVAFDPNNTAVTFDLIDLPASVQTLADQVTALVNQFLPTAIQAVATHFAPPPIPIPTINLALFSPAFQGRTGTFSGDLQFDGQTQRVDLAGDLITN